MAMHFNENLDDNGEMHDINVTPFIDVMLVLLIIFMVAAPLATVDVKVNLPASSSQPRTSARKASRSLMFQAPLPASNLGAVGGFTQASTWPCRPAVTAP